MRVGVDINILYSGSVAPIFKRAVQWVGMPARSDSSELLDYFDRLRENGVNVVFITDVGHGDVFAGRMGNDFASWHALRSDFGSDRSTQSAKGAYFGIYSGAMDVETTLPPGDPKGGSHGVLTWAVASALGKLGNASFSAFSEKIIAVWEPLVGNLSMDKRDLDPVFESSHPYRSPFATGLPTASSTGESRLRNVDTRRVEITAPAMQRGLARVGLGFVLIQGKIVSATPPKAISANQTLGDVFKDGHMNTRPSPPANSSVSTYKPSLAAIPSRFRSTLR